MREREFSGDAKRLKNKHPGFVLDQRKICKSNRYLVPDVKGTILFLNSGSNVL